MNRCDKLGSQSNSGATDSWISWDRLCARVIKVGAAVLLGVSALTTLAEDSPPVSQDIKTLQQAMQQKYGQSIPQHWGERVPGVLQRFSPSASGKRELVLTLDLCNQPRKNSFDHRLVKYLEQHQIPATFFVNAQWIDNNPKNFQSLANNPLFIIANHGTNHQPASVSGRKAYGIAGTKNSDELTAEIAINAKKIEQLTGKIPQFYRSGTAYYDEIATQIAQDLGHQVVGFSLLGDAGATFSAPQVRDALLAAKSGDIIIVHANHPSSGTAQGVMDAVAVLLKKRFVFVRLDQVVLQ